jgi:hypothetical protein
VLSVDRCYLPAYGQAIYCLFERASIYITTIEFWR